MTFRATRWVALLAVPLAGGLLLSFAAPAPSKETALVATVKRGDFRITVTASGELRASEFTPIRVPDADFVYGARIVQIVPEGTIVQPGDSVARLGAFETELEEMADNLLKVQNALTQAKFDTAISLAAARAQVLDLDEALARKRLTKERAVYEAPAIKEEVELDLAKAIRDMGRAKADLVTKEQQAAAKVREAAAEVDRQQAKVTARTRLFEQFTVRAPAAGMVVYKPNEDGRPPVRVGSWVNNASDPTFAILPDFRRMESVAYVNEVDVAKVAVGQSVRIGLDRDPWKRLTGKVTSVATVGQRQRSDAKLFKVAIQVELERPDSALRPGMTTSNVIETAVIRDARSMPIDAVVTAGDTTYVFKQEGPALVRQQVELGPAGANDVVVRRGLAAEDKVLLTEPVNGRTLPLKRLS